MPNLERGYIQVYTGNGKGKTTSALGLTLRAVGAGFKVFIAQFLKGQDYSELKALRERLSDLVVVKQYGTSYFVFKGMENDEIKEIVKKGWEDAKSAIFHGDFDIVVLDELNVVLYMGLLDVSEVVEVLKNKPLNLEVIITGRYAPVEIVEIADLVTEMNEIKHYYTKGVQARIGIEK